LVCEQKAFFKLSGEIGIKSSYESFKEKLAQMLIAKYQGILGIHNKVKNLSHRDPFIIKELDLTYAFLFNVKIFSSKYAGNIHALKILGKNSDNSCFTFNPILITTAPKIALQHRLKLAFSALKIRTIQDEYPSHGEIVYGENLKVTKIKLKNYLLKVKELIAKIYTLSSNETSPVLCKHCQICEFNSQCMNTLKKTDHLSLLKGIKTSEIKKLNDRGIFTINQLSYTYRPRRYKKNRNIIKRHSYALQALAIRKSKIYVRERPDIPSAEIKMYMDVEGDPDRNLYYLIGIVIATGETRKKLSFWIDSQDKEQAIINEFLDTMDKYDDYRIYHYGSYEKKFFEYLYQKFKNRKKLLKKLIDKSVNVLSLIYASVYFPTLSNGLKDIAGYLNFRWSNDNCSGLNSILFRRSWEQFHDDYLKRELIIYNIEDCIALEKIVIFLQMIANSDNYTNSTESAFLSTKLLDQKMLIDKGVHDFGRQKFALNDFKFINKCAYFDYQRNKIYVKIKKYKKLSTSHSKKIRVDYKSNKSIRIHSARKCPRCKSLSVRLNGYRRATKSLIDLKFTKNGIKRWVIEYHCYQQYCQDCKKQFLPKRYLSIRNIYGYNLASWIVYNNVVNNTGFEQISDIVNTCFNIRIKSSAAHDLKKRTAEYYRNWYKNSIKNIKKWEFIHCDETSIRVVGRKGYVWVFTNLFNVIYLFTWDRKADFIKNHIKGFKGVFISDFYSGFKSLECLHQKCLIHLIRDINTALFRDQQDQELQLIAGEFSALLRKIVETIDRRGLKRYYLKKYNLDVKKFYGKIVNDDYKSEVAQKFINRFIRYEDSLFTFLDHDGISWNNNNAENSLKFIASFRKKINGIFTEKGIEDYLVLFSLYKTCKNRNINFLNFLLSHEKNIESYLKKYTISGKKKDES
jgi:predicted RecB family nuclease